MGKRIIQQARGKGSMTYRVRRKAFKIKIGYPNLAQEIKDKALVEKLIHSPGHSAPLAKIKFNENKHFYVPACHELYEGQKIEINTKVIKEGNILALENIPTGTKIFNIEANPGDGGKIMRSAGSSATVIEKTKKEIKVLMPSKKRKSFNLKCRATIGSVAGAGKTKKPIVKAGNKYYMKKAKSKLWPRTSAVKVNAVDHPFGSGRGKRVKSKIAKRNAPPGRKVGLLRPKRTGRKKR